jgi:septal ring factor EnvC (AmiA/AmiB activator)
VTSRPRGRVAFAAVLAAAAALGPGLAQEPAPTPADPRLRRVQERRTSLERELERLRRDEKGLLGEVERLEVEVRLRAEEAREAQLRLERTNALLDQTAARVRALSASIEAERPGLRARARDLYKMGEMSYLRLLLSVERPADFIAGYRHVTALARRDRERVGGFRRDLDEMERQQAALQERTREAMEQRAELVRRRRALEAERRRQTERLTALVARKETHAAYVEELRQAEEQLAGLLSGLAPGAVQVPIAAFRGSLPWPAPGRVIAGFGRRRHPRFDTYTVQNGIELDAPAGAPVAAVHEGTVAFAERFRGYGLMAIVDHGGGNHTLYAHLAELAVKVGDRVAAGTVLGNAGEREEGGRGLYFELRRNGQPEDPQTWLAERPAR